MPKKVSLAAIRLHAGEMTDKANTVRDKPEVNRKEITQALIDAHEKLGIEIDFSETSFGSTDLNFAGDKPDFARTRPWQPVTP